MKNYDNPYELMKCLMLKPSEFLKLPDKIKNNKFFLLNRILSQKFPQVANRFNRNGINGAACLDFYAYLFMAKRHSKLPGWVYSKMASKHKKKKTLDKDFIIWLKTNYEFHDLDIQFLEDFSPDELKNYKKSYNAYIKSCS